MTTKNQPTIVITGCTRGLGRAMVDAFSAAGATVLGCARSEEQIAKLGDPQRFHSLDITDDAAVENFASHVIDNFGAPDFLINNAAVINRNAPLWEITSKEFATVTNVNINGTANTIRHFVPAMIERGQGIIVNFSSGWGRSTSPEVAPYCATKFAIEGLTSALAQELPTGLAAIALNPGIIDTDMLRTSFGESASSYPTAEEWAKTAAPYIINLDPSDNGRAVTAP